MPVPKFIRISEIAEKIDEDNKMFREEISEMLRRAEVEQAIELDLSEYEITQLPPEIGKLTALQILIVRGLHELPREIGQLRNLSRLCLSSNHLNRLPREIACLKNLRMLDLSCNQLSEFPKEILQLKNLSRLYLSFNKLMELPREIAQIRNLSILYLSSNHLRQLPKELGQLRELSILDLSSNQLTELPEEFAQLRSLSELNLGGNRLTKLPGEFSRLGNLSELNLSSNQLLELPKEFSQLRKLGALYLDANQIREIPGEFVQLENLAELNLSSNQLRELPSELGRLRNLSRLYLSFNQLDELPPGMGALTNLNILDLSSNRLRMLPKEISQLGGLTVLYLDSNELSTLPREIARLRQLIHLDLNKNPLTFPPPEIASQGVMAIREYLEKSGKGGQTLYEGKILIVGQGGVGKSCLIKRLTENEYADDLTSTEGIDIHTWNVSAPDSEKTQMTLNIWDFGGQEIYHATHQFFLTQRSLYILVWDARQEEEYGRIDYWLNSIETFADDSPILIVMNKADERNKDMNLKELKQRCPQIIASAKTSAKEGTGIKSLRSFVRKQAWQLPLMGTFWPSSWLAVRKAMKATPKYHIPYKRYLKVCKKLGIDENEAGTLSRYLHDLGLVLHFQDDPLLKDTIILKPEWGTDAVYKVLDAKPVRERNGILYHSDLPKIWKNRKLYPKDKYATILRLMANFELAFPFGDGDRYIVAEFLPLLETAYTWAPKDFNQFEYHYEFLPAGVITRLIVRLHEFLMEQDEKKLCWREGAYFRRGNSQAMVKMRTYEKIVTIQVDGPEKRDFLALIRSHFTAIHKNVKKVRAKEKVPCTCRPGCKYRFDFSFLLKCEEKGMKNVICEESADYISVGNLLNSIENPEARAERLQKQQEGKYKMPFGGMSPTAQTRKQKSHMGVGTSILEFFKYQTAKVTSALWNE